MPSTVQPRLRPAILQGPAAVWVLNGLIATAAAWLYLAHVEKLGPITGPQLPWWALVLLFAAGERAVVHLHFQRSAHSFSLGDVPLVLGLTFASGHELLLAGALGAALPLALDRRLPPLKTAFNLGQFTLGACLAAAILHAIAPDDGGFGPVEWIATFAAVQASALVSVGLIGAAIALSEGSVSLATLRGMALRDMVVTVTNTSIALSAAVLIAADPRALPLILVPVATVFLAYRAYMSEHQRHDRLEFLYEATRTLAQAPEVILALQGLLTRSLAAFRTELAEVVLLSTEGQPPLRTTLTADGGREVMTPMDPAVTADLAAMVQGEGQVLVLEPADGTPRVRAYLESQGVTHAMLALLHADDRTVGTLMLANRPGVVSGFDDDDLKLFDALANNTSVALQFDRLEQSIWQLRELQEQLQHQAFHDPLTDLANRALFHNQVRDALATGHSPVAVLFVDVDDFKTINDTLGHAIGDELLTKVADRLRTCVLPRDVVARLGGDEFAVLVQHADDPEATGRAVAERVLEAFERPAMAGGKPRRIGLSIGIAVAHPGSESADEVIRNADIAMYSAKRAGKNGWRLFEAGMHVEVVHRHSLITELEAAIPAGEIHVAYQPILSLSDDGLRGAEALIRWHPPGRDPVPPSLFVPMAEETGLIRVLGQLVLQTACGDVRRWLDEGKVDEDFAVQVNLSAVELEDPALIGRVESALRSAGLDPRHLVLELTESAVMRDTVRGASTLRELKELGVQLALDDFGTGYSSLSLLRTMSVDMLKIPRPFVQGAGDHPNEVSFLRMMVDLGRTLGLRVVAEGIETTEQLDVLRSLGCDLGQGFLLGRPERVLARTHMVADGMV